MSKHFVINKVTNGYLCRFHTNKGEVAEAVFEKYDKLETFLKTYLKGE